MAAPINGATENMLSVAKRNLTKKTTEKTSEQPKMNTGAVESPVGQTDTVEITNKRYRGNDSGQSLNDETVVDADAAWNKVAEVKEMISGGYDNFQIAQIHNVNGEKLAGLLA